jgi:hypothetical protein
MLTAYIDDSGTDPNQKIAIASALMIPSARLTALNSEWAALANKEGFTSFHMSECIAQNAESEFADWDEHKRRRVVWRVRQMVKKFGGQAISFCN